MLENLYQRLEALYPELVEFRRDLHMYPELSFHEEQTPQKIANYLEQLGLEVRTGVGGRGVVAKLVGGKPGKTVALRADFDALPIQDEKEVEYRSKVPGVMHACGHDIHTAALLGVAKVLSEHREGLEGNVVFIHQFAEELAPGGAKPMIEDGCLDGVDVIFGAHVWSALPIGTIGVNDGFMMAASDAFEIEIQGKGGHGATPHLTVDSIVVASQMVMQLQQIVARRVDPLKPAVVTVGSIQGGKAFNVIADTTRLTGTVRTFHEEVREQIVQEIERIAEHAAQSAGATAKLKYQYGYPALYNHTQETKQIEVLAQQLVGQDKVTRMEPIMGGEDYAYYLQHVPGTFFFVGGGNPDIQATYPHHHPRFDVDEKSILITGKCFIAAVLDTLSGGKLQQEQSHTTTI